MEVAACGPVPVLGVSPESSEERGRVDLQWGWEVGGMGLCTGLCSAAPGVRCGEQGSLASLCPGLGLPPHRGPFGFMTAL